jgi:hypothetical protein
MSYMGTPAPYDTAQIILNTAISLAGDGGGPQGMLGNILNPNRNPQVMPTLFERWRYFQQRLRSAGSDTFSKDAIIYAIPASTGGNPSILMALGFFGLWDGSEWIAADSTSPPNTLILPQDCIKPLELWSRVNGSIPWGPMRQEPDSLNARSFAPRFTRWNYINERLQLNPTSQPNDLKLQYIYQAEDITSLNTVLPVRGCQTAMGYLILDVLTRGRGGSQEASYSAKAEEAINQIINETTRKENYVTDFRRKPFRSGRRGRRSGM